MIGIVTNYLMSNGETVGFGMTDGITSPPIIVDAGGPFTACTTTWGKHNPEYQNSGDNFGKINAYYVITLTKAGTTTPLNCSGPGNPLSQYNIGSGAEPLDTDITVEVFPPSGQVFETGDTIQFYWYNGNPPRKYYHKYFNLLFHN